jgi:hypothetical protein
MSDIKSTYEAQSTTKTISDLPHTHTPKNTHRSGRVEDIVKEIEHARKILMALTTVHNTELLGFWIFSISPTFT